MSHDLLLYQTGGAQFLFVFVCQVVNCIKIRKLHGVCAGVRLCMCVLGGGNGIALNIHVSSVFLFAVFPCRSGALGSGALRFALAA